MALDPEKIAFLNNQISDMVKAMKYSDMKNIMTVLKQLFTYLSEESKNNSVYMNFESQDKKWADWLKSLMTIKSGAALPAYGKWELPKTLEESKHLSYTLYKALAIKPDEGHAFGMAYFLFHEPSLINDILKNFILHDAISVRQFQKFHSTFFGYFQQALGDILKGGAKRKP